MDLCFFCYGIGLIDEYQLDIVTKR